jgi:hypothetical protein
MPADREVLHAPDAPRGRDATALRNTCLALVAAAQTALWWRAIHWYPLLPERFPVHFGASGKPDRWADKGAEWFLLPAISLAMLVFLGGITLWLGALVRTTPGIVNVPRKDLFLKLSPAGRMRVVAPTRTFMAWVLALMSLLFLAILEGSARVAVKETDTLGLWPLLVFLPGVLGVVPFYWMRTARILEQAARDEGLDPRTGKPAVSVSGTDEGAPPA